MNKIFTLKSQKIRTSDPANIAQHYPMLARLDDYIQNKIGGPALADYLSELLKFLPKENKSDDEGSYQVLRKLCEILIRLLNVDFAKEQEKLKELALTEIEPDTLSSWLSNPYKHVITIVRDLQDTNEFAVEAARKLQEQQSKLNKFKDSLRENQKPYPWEIAIHLIVDRWLNAYFSASERRIVNAELRSLRVYDYHDGLHLTGYIVVSNVGNRSPVLYDLYVEKEPKYSSEVSPSISYSRGSAVSAEILIEPRLFHPDIILAEPLKDFKARAWVFKFNTNTTTDSALCNHLVVQSDAFIVRPPFELSGNDTFSIVAKIQTDTGLICSDKVHFNLQAQP